LFYRRLRLFWENASVSAIAEGAGCVEEGWLGQRGCAALGKEGGRREGSGLAPGRLLLIAGGGRERKSFGRRLFRCQLWLRADGGGGYDRHIL